MGQERCGFYKDDDCRWAEIVHTLGTLEVLDGSSIPPEIRGLYQQLEGMYPVYSFVSMKPEGFSFPCVVRAPRLNLDAAACNGFAHSSKAEEILEIWNDWKLRVFADALPEVANL